MAALQREKSHSEDVTKGIMQSQSVIYPPLAFQEVGVLQSRDGRNL